MTLEWRGGRVFCFPACGSANCLNCLPIIHPTQWPDNTMQHCAIPWDTLQYHAIACNDMKYPIIQQAWWRYWAITWSTRLYILIQRHKKCKGRCGWTSQKCKVRVLWDNRSWSLSVGNALPTLTSFLLLTFSHISDYHICHLFWHIIMYTMYTMYTMHSHSDRDQFFPASCSQCWGFWRRCTATAEPWNTKAVHQ